MNHRRLLAVMVALAACLPDRAFRPAPARMDVPVVDAADDRIDVEVAEATVGDVPDAEATVGDAADADADATVGDATDGADADAVDAAATCADACADGEGCFAGSCRAQRSCPRSDTDAGCGLVEIPDGSFVMNPDGGPDAGGRELPGITVGGFVMDSHEVTVARFRVFWDGGVPELPDRPIRYPNGTDIATAGWVAEPPMGPTEALPVCHWSETPGAYEQHPINCVSKRMAQAFCVWDAGGGEGGGRLPTSAEWEYAAVGRYRDGRSFPWGTTLPSNDCSDRRAHFLACLGDGGARTVPVGTFLPSGGLFDLAGNVNEWVADERSAYGYLDLCWWRAERSDPFCPIAHPTHPPPPDAGIDDAPFTLRGGGYSSPVEGIMSARPGRARDAPYEDVGFRCVRARGVSSPDRNDAGTGACPVGQVRCGSDCVDPLAERNHCGRCGNRCGVGTACQRGRCVEAQASCTDADARGCGVTLVRGGEPFDILEDPVNDGGMLSARVSVSDFALDTYEVTVARFRAFRAMDFRAVRSSVVYPNEREIPVSAPQEPGGPSLDARCNWTETRSREDHPMNCVDKNTAQAFCVWDGGGRGRLPTRAEWEYAARAVGRAGLPAVRRWPWGDEDDACSRGHLGPDANCGMLPGGSSPATTRPVGAAVAGQGYQPYGGFFDMVGNLSEWVIDVRTPGVDITACWRVGSDAGVLPNPLCLTASNESYITGADFAQIGPYRGLGLRGGSSSDSGRNWAIGFRCARSP